MRKVLPYLCTAQGFLALTVCAALITPFSAIAGMAAALAALFLCFPRKYGAVLAAAYLIIVLTGSFTAFVLDISYNGKGRSYYTTKGYLKGIEGEFRTGDLIVGKFRFRTYTSGALPRRRAEPEGTFTAFRVPLISAILEKRQRHASYLYNASGGVITTAQTHTMAVRQYIPDHLRDEYIITGLAHLLAMSGFHVGIFTAGIFLLFCFLPGRLKALPVILLLPLLIPLSGFTVTVVRAVIFAVAAMTAWMLDLRILSLRFLAVVAAGILLVSPYSLYSISFLMSFFAVFGIVIIFKGRYRWALKIITVGIASTVFTLPLQLYFFGTSNIMSVLTTVILTPVVWLQMVLSVLSFVFPVAMIAPLSLVERFAAWLMEHTYSFSWYFLYVAKPPTVLLVASFFVAFVLCFTRLRPLSVGMLLLPLLPLYPKDTLIFPVLPASQKGYILTSEAGSEIFFQGMRSTFTRVMVPQAARLGIKTFDYGRIRIFDGENLYLKIKSPEAFTGTVCVNEDGCPYVYCTRSNSLKEPLDPATGYYIIYRNKPIDPRIISQADVGEVTFSLKGDVHE